MSGRSTISRMLLVDIDEGVTTHHLYPSGAFITHYEHTYAQLRSRNYPDHYIKTHDHHIDNDCTENCVVFHRGDLVK